MQTHKIFIYDNLKVFFKHTDYYGFVHPYNYLEWMSYIREAFFQELVRNFLELCEREIKMVTALAEFELLKDARFGDSIVCDIYAENVKKISFDVVFEFYQKEHSDLVLGKGRQKITFLNGVTGRPELIPEDLKCVVLQYQKISINPKD